MNSNSPSQWEIFGVGELTQKLTNTFERGIQKLDISAQTKSKTVKQLVHMEENVLLVTSDNELHWYGRNHGYFGEDCRSAHFAYPNAPYINTFFKDNGLNIDTINTSCWSQHIITSVYGSNDLYCFGSNYEGNLNLGERYSQKSMIATPTKMDFFTKLHEKCIQIATGSNITVYLAQAGGAL
ncbi:hypothetical protein RFI_19280 [Reticulomyxa filosa]|uniref:Uncharacterized protein n=1 Tax=Reticulomyxa filosa TaxID=46433 RepID=X6MX19_RETFI|nr:hypothetical protein RFI_19280 [Reticulomyxa filosa]|eukprot:ETO18017.1 hypothetical protein RFI_19280 [Reticulomyxa filosa]